VAIQHQGAGAKSVKAHGKGTGLHRRTCGRRGSYPIDRLIERYGIDAKHFEPEADCPRKIRKKPYDACGARCPDLSKVL
jgi:hypothetical protein